ncbi:MAG TPA: hypothetical protein VJL60_01000, partial [Gammaproteobacteria bacterium]|nr:hypothetical protein [Gammaproteobacteria bacterium]
DSPQWVMRLRFYIPELLPKLRAYAGLETIQSICCKARPSHFAATKQKNRPKQVISSENAAILREAAHKLRDDKLRAILEKIALRVNSA